MVDSKDKMTRLETLPLSLEYLERVKGPEVNSTLFFEGKWEERHKNNNRV